MVCHNFALVKLPRLICDMVCQTIAVASVARARLKINLISICIIGCCRMVTDHLCFASAQGGPSTCHQFP